MILHPDADPGRRAWGFPCTCRDDDGCPTCAAGRNCTGHARWLLNSAPFVVRLQCGTCGRIWVQDTRLDIEVDGDLYFEDEEAS